MCPNYKKKCHNYKANAIVMTKMCDSDKRN